MISENKLLKQHVHAVQEGNLRLFRQIADKSIVFKYGPYLLMTAIDWPSSEIFAELIQMDVPVNSNKHSKLESLGRTPLHQAVFRDNAKYVQILLEKGAQVNATDEFKYRPIHLVSDVKCLNLLLNFGADLNPLDHSGESPFWKISLSPLPVESKIKLLKIFLDNGIDITRQYRKKLSLLNYLKSLPTDQSIKGPSTKIYKKILVSYIPL